MKNRAFPAQNITQKPASIFLQNSLGELVRLSQVQKCFQSDPKPLQISFYEVSIKLNFMLINSLTQISQA